MLFCIVNRLVHCPYRTAGRALCRRMGQGAINITMLLPGGGCDE